ncbi:MAG TPA: four helix bundle protein [Chitinophagales bacterium]|nr:four helix bundle protein [Chitinophagales bacterium]
MTNEELKCKMEEDKDLKLRTKKLAVAIALFCEQLPSRRALNVYSNQLLRASSSVGANCRTACIAKSPADFLNKLKIVEEELDVSWSYSGYSHQRK